MRKIIVFILLFAVSGVLAQDSRRISDLELQRKKALADIEATSRLLSENKKTTSNALTRLSLLTQQINSRKEVIRLLNGEIESTERQMKVMELNIRTLERELQAKKDIYAESLQKMYTNKSNQNKLLFIFSADNFTQSYRRILYLKEFAKWGRQQAEEIITKQKKLAVEKDKLEKSRKDKMALLENKRTEEDQLQGEEDIQKKEVQSLKVQQKELVSELNKKKKQAQALNQAIEKAIAEEVARAEREARMAAEAKALAERNKEKIKEQNRAKSKEKSKASEKEAVPEKREETTRVAETTGGYAMTKEERTLSSSFVNNKGSLPYPVKGNYKIVSHFGLQQHQDLKYVTTNNNGIDIQTTPGNNARSIFNGVISRIFVVPGYNSSVIVRHGNYLTVYSNLSEVFVKQGDNISTGQNLGKIFTDDENGNETILHFEIRKEKDKLNPESWLSR